MIGVKKPEESSLQPVSPLSSFMDCILAVGVKGDVAGSLFSALRNCSHSAGTAQKKHVKHPTGNQEVSDA